jgi:hypothetical protein
MIPAADRNGGDRYADWDAAYVLGALSSSDRHAYERQSPFLDAFDGADVMECYRRSVTVVPQQALALTNSELVHRCSTAMAESLWERLTDDERSDAEAFVTTAFEQILSRPPRDAELAVCTQFLTRSTDAADETDEAAVQDRASLVRALFNHTDFITIR